MEGRHYRTSSRCSMFHFREGGSELCFLSDSEGANIREGPRTRLARGSFVRSARRRVTELEYKSLSTCPADRNRKRSARYR